MAIEKVEYLRDGRGQLTVENIIEKSNLKWKRLGGDELNFGFDKSAHWIRSKIPKCNESGQERFLRITYPILDYVSIWMFSASNKNLATYHTGDAVAFDKRPIESSQFFFPISCDMKSFTLRVQTSGSAQIPLDILNYKQFNSAIVTHEYSYVLFLGGALMIACYNFLLFIVIRKTIYLSYVGFVVSFICFQMNMSGLGFRFLWPEWPFLNQLMTDKFLILIALSGSLFGLEYMRVQKVAPELIKVEKIYLCSLAFLTLFNLFASNSLAVRLAIVWIIFGVLQLTYLMVKSIIARQREGYIFASAWSFMMAGAIMSAFNKLGYLPTNAFTLHSLLIGSGIEMLTLSFALADRLNLLKTELKKSNNKLNTLLGNIELTVEEKTRDIRAIMENIEQGIFTISANKDGKLKINQEYSKFSHSIIGSEAIGGHDPIKRIFGRTGLNDEKLAIIQNVIESSLGDSRLQFISNHQLLPLKIEISALGADRTMLLKWSPIFDKEDHLDKILLSLTDVTGFNELQKLASSKQKEVEMLIEISSIPHNQFNQFIKTAKQYIDEIKYVLNQHVFEDEIEFKRVPRNVHTMKGLARSCGLHNLSALIHDQETQIINHGKLRSEAGAGAIYAAVDILENEVQSYWDLAVQKLGRKEEDNHVLLEIERLEQWYQQGHSLVSKQVQSQNKLVLKEMMHDIRSSYAITLKMLVDEYKKSMQKMAAKLGKNQPRFVISNSDVFIGREYIPLMNSILTHLLGNSIDHGIESSAARKRSGKETTGNIFISVEPCPDSDDYLIIRYHDDGRGANLHQLYEKSKQLGTEMNVIDLNSLLATMFITGFSTARELSDISGRGIGMGAVKNLLLEHDCDISIHPIYNHMDGFNSSNHALDIDFKPANLPEYLPFYLDIRVKRSFFLS